MFCCCLKEHLNLVEGRHLLKMRTRPDKGTESMKVTSCRGGSAMILLSHLEVTRDGISHLYPGGTILLVTVLSFPKWWGFLKDSGSVDPSLYPRMAQSAGNRLNSSACKEWGLQTLAHLPGPIREREEAWRTCSEGRSRGSVRGTLIQDGGSKWTTCITSRILWK